MMAPIPPLGCELFGPEIAEDHPVVDARGADDGDVSVFVIVGRR
jgi:hypothetical protein